MPPADAARAPDARGYGLAFLAYLALFVAVMAPFVLRGEVLANDTQARLVGELPSASPGRLETSRYADYPTVFLPELAAHLRGPRSGWLATWTPYNALGRPLYHDGGTSPAWLPMRMLGWASDDPMRVMTAYALGTVFVAGLFAFVLVRELRLAPVAALAAAAFVALSPFLLFWLCFPMFNAVPAWTLGALYALARMHARPGLGAWTLLAFCLYSLLLTGYEQDVVAHAYLMLAAGGYALWRVARERGGRAAVRFGAACAAAAVLGAACAAPVFLDLAGTARDSARMDFDVAFFTDSLPDLHSAAGALRYATAMVFQDAWGNPVADGFEHGTEGITLLPLYLLLAAVGAVAAARRTWGLTLVAAICVLPVVFPSLYAFAVEHLGFHLSRSNPLSAAQLPLAGLVAFGADRLLRGEGGRAARAALAGGGVLLGLAAAWVLRDMRAAGESVAWAPFVLAGAAAAACAVAAWRPRAAPLLLGAAVAATTWLHASGLPLSQPRTAIAADSPLLAQVRAHARGGRFAVLEAHTALAPNFNAMVALPSVHSYDSLASRRYQALMARLGATARSRGRNYRDLGDDLDAVDFALAGVSVVLSPRPVAHAGLAPVGEAGGLHLYSVEDYRGCCLRVEAGRLAVDAAALRGADWTSVRPVVEQGDHREFEVVPRAGASRLVLSQAFHARWRAHAWVDGAWQPAPTAPVNDFFQSVAVPARAERIRLRFEPFARWAWIGHVVFVALALLLAGLAAWRRR